MERLSLAMLEAFAKFVAVISELDTYFRLLASAGTLYKVVLVVCTGGGGDSVCRERIGGCSVGGGV